MPDVVTLTNGIFAENCYLVADRESREAVVVDPGEEAALFLARLRTEGWKATAIWLTHAHVDHVAGVAAVHRATGAPVHLHPADRDLYESAPLQAAAFGLTAESPPPPDCELADGQMLSVGRCSFEVMHLPGHSPGHVAFAGHGLVLAGDVLFAGSIGRTDLPGGSLPQLLDSIRSRLFRLPDETRVLPGHGPETTIGAEKRTNPFVKLQPGINACLRCGAEVHPKPWGCKNPCPNCGFVYPLGDCSD
ncbi:MAG TPA: MBL fold metallo-hydrolase [Gemmatimonadales bacterium]|nr:MBL fold metallo-hydrolase [Gemmatimonadales bacterium]